MKDTLEETLKPIIEKSIEIATKTGEFIIDQAPIVLQEFYKWHIIQHALWIVITLIGVFLLPIIVRFFPEDDSHYSVVFFGKKIDESTAIVLGVFGGFASLLSIASMLFNLFMLLKILIAPRLYVMEYFLN